MAKPKRNGNNPIVKLMLNEMRKRSLTKQEFAKLVGVSHTTIGRILASDSAPSLEFLAKLAVAIGYDLCTLVSLIHPEATSTNPQRQIIADQINTLPPDLQDQAVIFILGLLAKRLEKNSEDS